MSEDQWEEEVIALQAEVNRLVGELEDERANVGELEREVEDLESQVARMEDALETVRDIARAAL